MTAAPSIICHRPPTRAAQVGRPRPRPIDLAATADAGVPPRWSTERRAGHGSHIAAASGTRSTARKSRSSASHAAAPPCSAFTIVPRPPATDDRASPRDLTRIRQPPSTSTPVQSAEPPSRSHATGSGTTARRSACSAITFVPPALWHDEAAPTPPVEGLPLRRFDQEQGPAVEFPVADIDPEGGLDALRADLDQQTAGRFHLCAGQRLDPPVIGDATETDAAARVGASGHLISQIAPGRGWSGGRRRTRSA